MSARWRRSRSSKKFNIFKVFKRGKERNTPQKYRTKSSRVKWQACPQRRRIQNFSGERTLKDPRPLIDVLEGDSEIAVIAEFAGFNREDLRIHVKNQRLTLSAATLDRKYYKSLNLPKRVIPSTICTTYKNGVLEIRLKKTVEEKPIDKVAG